MLNVKRWVGLIGLTVLVSVLVTGLMSGTALAQGPNPQLVEAHGGQVGIASQVSRGTTFIITLPVT